MTLQGTIALDWSRAEWERYLDYASLVREERRLRELERKVFLEELEEIEVADGEEPPDPEKMMPPHLRDEVHRD